MRKLFILMGFLLLAASTRAENGYDLWLRYPAVTDPGLASRYRQAVKQLIISGNSSVIQSAGSELRYGLKKMLSVNVPANDKATMDGALIVGTPQMIPAIKTLQIPELAEAGQEGFVIKSVVSGSHQATIITANTDVGILYGVFNFLRLIQTAQNLDHLHITDYPRVTFRVLNHWDNLDGTIERGYAGSSLWDWQRLPGYLDPRYKDYARANASIGINGVVLNNVNAKAKSLTRPYIIKAAALADVFRAYGIRVYLTARFSAPIELGHLQTADPLDPEVKRWWKEKADEIYQYIPDFGGFLVKANSEGQPGPQDYRRTHADGANALAEAVEPHGGMVMWRAFVYENKKGSDRAMQAYNEFKPLDGKFNKNVFLQVKYGPVDFQPREAFHPLFGAMPKTPIAPEFEITQEYLGFASHLVYLAPLIKEYLETDTYAQGKGSTITKIMNGTLEGHQLSAIAGVANIGSDINWCGHPFGQANWYAFGRLAWNSALTSAQIADEWLKMTFVNDPSFVKPVKQMMLQSREAAVNYMMPLGLNHIMNLGTHYGPGPWDKIPGWNAWDYHRSDSIGIGTDRTSSGTNAVSQYFPPLNKVYAELNTCPEKYLLWFHHVPWTYKLPSGQTLWTELVNHYYAGVNSVDQMIRIWDTAGKKIDPERYQNVEQLLQQQKKEAMWWRDGCVLYFQTYSKLPLPQGLPAPAHPLSYYEHISFPDE
jgi:alpha-glucuronidase